mmetsp:Transcript_27813/g.26633  ORF Transcript_27813/g.26633 Transcript_27813/m.26633 type:complete len:353 (-) Transcript_27813:288-1346(-)
MDQTKAFLEAVASVGTDRQQLKAPHRIYLSSSPFVLRASQLLTQISSFETLLAEVVDPYVDYHRYHPSRVEIYRSSASMTDQERLQFTQEITLFVATFATEVRELKRSMRGVDTSSPYGGNRSGEEVGHRDGVITYLLERLSGFTKRSQRLQKEREKYSLNPFSLFSSTTPSLIDISKISLSKNEKKNETKKDFTHLMNKLNKNEKKTEPVSTSPVRTPLPQTFVDRYESEIAPPKKLNEYKSLGVKHKDLLLKETKKLQLNYSKDMIETNKMEATVIKISNLLYEFVSILQTQREGVDEVNQTGKVSIDLVKETDVELMLTISRSENSLKSMIILTVGLGFILLLLDFITP